MQALWISCFTQLQRFTDCWFNFLTNVSFVVQYLVFNLALFLFSTITLNPFSIFFSTKDHYKILPVSSLQVFLCQLSKTIRVSASTPVQASLVTISLCLRDAMIYYYHYYFTLLGSLPRC